MAAVGPGNTSNAPSEPPTVRSTHAAGPNASFPTVRQRAPGGAATTRRPPAGRFNDDHHEAVRGVRPRWHSTPLASRVAACPSSRGSANRLGVPASKALFPVNQVKHFSRQPRFSLFNFLPRQRKTTLGNAGVSIESHIPRGSPRLTTGAVMPATFCTAGSGIRHRPTCIPLVKLTGFWIDKGNRHAR